MIQSITSPFTTVWGTVALAAALARMFASFESFWINTRLSRSCFSFGSFFSLAVRLGSFEAFSELRSFVESTSPLGLTATSFGIPSGKKQQKRYNERLGFFSGKSNSVGKYFQHASFSINGCNKRTRISYTSIGSVVLHAIVPLLERRPCFCQAGTLNRNSLSRATIWRWRKVHNQKQDENWWCR